MFDETIQSRYKYFPYILYYLCNALHGEQRVRNVDIYSKRRVGMKIAHHFERFFKQIQHG